MLVELEPAKLAAYGISASAIHQALQMENRATHAGVITERNEALSVHLDGFFRSMDDVNALVVGIRNNTPVYLRDVARVTDGPEEPADYVFFSPGPAAAIKGIQIPQSIAAPADPASAASIGSTMMPAVTITFAKRKGKNAVVLAEAVMEKAEHFRARNFPASLQMTLTRDYGETASEKSNELLLHMMIAVVSVTLLIWLILGFRESGRCGGCDPVTLALTLVVFLLYGYTLNRITLFALIFSIGILVDDAIVVIENIVRHSACRRIATALSWTLRWKRSTRSGIRRFRATFTVIAAILPMPLCAG
jgi:multidrug efflux pump subunit AcrB